LHDRTFLDTHGGVRKLLGQQLDLLSVMGHLASGILEIRVLDETKLAIVRELTWALRLGAAFDIEIICAAVIAEVPCLLAGDFALIPCRLFPKAEGTLLGHAQLPGALALSAFRLRLLLRREADTALLDELW
jgi:hypothetical protein